MWKFKRKKFAKKRASSVTKHYQEHKEIARALASARLQHFNLHYDLRWNRIAIRNQRRCWGSCSSLTNLNFNYKIQFLPPHLQDYIFVHELCHLTHLNHGRDFWNLVGEVIPDYRNCIVELQAIDKGGNSVNHLLKTQEAFILKYLNESNV